MYIFSVLLVVLDTVAFLTTLPNYGFSYTFFVIVGVYSLLSNCYLYFFPYVANAENGYFKGLLNLPESTATLISIDRWSFHVSFWGKHFIHCCFRVFRSSFFISFIVQLITPKLYLVPTTCIARDPIAIISFFELNCVLKFFFLFCY